MYQKRFQGSRSSRGLEKYGGVQLSPKKVITEKTGPCETPWNPWNPGTLFEIAQCSIKTWNQFSKSEVVLFRCRIVLWQKL